MGIFGSKKKISLGRSSASNDDDFDFDSLEDMSDEFGDDHNVSTDRKATIKNYVTDHYKNKFTDRGERKKLIKQALPPSYSGPVDLAHDLKDDYDQIKYEVGKEWEKVKSPLKKALKQNSKYLRMVGLGRAANWAEEEERSRYQEEEANQDEALVQSMLAEFTNPQAGKELAERMESEQKVRQAEREDASEFRDKSISLQLQGATNTGNAVAELRKLVNYQDQVTFLYQKKSLEVGIRSLLEHRKQTDILRVYKDESIAELKEIHKNTGLPEVVKTNNSEIASQIFKEKMIGKASAWFDGKFGTLRKRITTRIRDRLTEMTRDLGTSLTSWNEMMETANETGDTSVSLLGKMGADAGLNKIWEKVTGRPLNWVRNKLQSNSKIARFGRGASALQKNLGGVVNKGLLSGSTGNKFLDKIVDWAGLRQAAVTRDDTMRQSLSKNLDTAAYMDQKFKQTVERVIPHWLSLIYKENHLMRMGWGFKEGDGKDGTIKFEQKTWSWDKEDLVNESEIKNDVLGKVLDRDRIKSFGASFERLLTHMGAQSLTRPTKEKLKAWVNKRITSSMSATLYDLLLDLPKFTKKQQEELKLMICWKSGLSEEVIEDSLETGAWEEAALMFNTDKFAKWMDGYASLEQDFAGKSLIDWNHIQDMVNQGHEKILEEAGYLVRQKDGTLVRNMDLNQDLAMKMTKMKHKKTVHLKEGEGEEYKNKRGQTRRKMSVEVDEAKSHRHWEDFANNDPQLENDVYKMVQMLMDSATMDARDEKKRKALQKTFMNKILYMTEHEAKKQGLLERKAAGGFIGRFAKGGATDFSDGGHTGDGPVDGPVKAILDGKEFVTDATTTEKNKKLLAFMNKFKASVVLPDGSVNPVYYKAFGFESEEDFKNAHRNSELTSEHKQMARSVKDQGALPYIKMLFESIDLSKLSDAEIKAITDPKAPSAEVIKALARIKAQQEKKSIGQTIRGGVGKGLSWLNSDRSASKGKLQGKKDEYLKSAKTFMGEAKKELGSHTEEQLESLFWEIAQHTDPELITEKDHVYFEDASVSWKDKVLKISNINFYRGNRSEFVKSAFSKWSSSLGQEAKGRFMRFINGSDDDTHNTDELKKLGGKIKGKGQEMWSNRDKMVDAAMRKMRVKKAQDLALKAWKDNAVDIYIVGSPDAPRLTAEGFVAGEYIDQLTGRVCSSHHDITGPVSNAKGDVLLTPSDLQKGFCDKEGNPITVSVLKRYRNIAKEEATKLYNKYGKKHVDRLSKGMLTLTEKWQNMFRNTSVNVYVGDEKEPRLTIAGFNNGEYLSATTKKPLKGWDDIDGPVMARDGVYIITQKDLESKPLLDKDGNTLQPPKLLSNMERLKGIMFKALGVAGVTKFAKKGWDKAKGFYNKRVANKFSALSNEAVDVYIDGQPVLLAVDFKAGKLIDAEGKPLANHYQITGPVSRLKEDGTTEIVLSQEMLEKGGWTDAEGKPLPLTKMGKVGGLLTKGLRDIKASFMKGFNRFGKKAETATEESAPVNPVSLDTVTAKNAEAIYHKDVINGSLAYLFNAQDMFDGLVYTVDPNAPDPDASISKITSFSYLHKGQAIYVIRNIADIQDKPITWALLREVAREALKAFENDGVWRDGNGKKLNAKKLKAMEEINEVAPALPKLKKPSFLAGMKSAFMAGFKGKEKPEDEVNAVPVNKKTIYYKDPMTGGLLPVFTMDEIKNGQVYTVNPHAENPDASVSKVTSFMYLQKGVSVYVVTDLSVITEGTAINYNWLTKNAQCVCSSAFNSGKWFDEQGKKLSAKSLSKLDAPDARSDKKAGGLKGKLMGWKDKAKAMLSGKGGEETDKDGKPVRKGSWQEKLANKTKDSWIGKLASAFGFGKKDKDGKEKKKSWLGKILGGVALLGGTITKALFGLGGLLTKGLFSLAGMVVKPLLGGMAKLAGWIVSPLIKGLGLLGTKIMSAVKGNGLMGKFGGKALRVAGAVGGAAMMYQGLKGEDKVDENGNPVLDENGQPVKERNWGQAALGAGMTALSIPGAAGALGAAAGAVGSGLAAAAGFLAPIALPLAAAAAVGYGAYKAFGWWKKASAKKDYPMTAFRINQYGFDMTDQTVMETIMKLEATLQPNVVFSGDKANFKNDIDVESVFAVFGLKFQGGDGEKNKKFLTWFLGRFKPVYIAYVRAMKSVKNTTDLNDMEKKLTAFQALQVLDKVHFKNQSDLNPYNIMVSPFEDPDECDYDFDDIGKRYEDVKELLKEQAAKSPEGDKSLETQKKEDDEDKWSVKNIAKTAFKYSPAGAAVWAIKKSGQGIKDALTWVSEGLGKTFGGMWDKFTGVIGEKWQSFKDTVKGIWEAISNPLDFAKKLATGAMDKVGETVDNVKDSVSSAGQAASGAWDDAKNAIGLNSKVGTGEKGIIAAGKAAGMTDEELAMFLAQTAHESGNFRSTTENLNYSATTLMKLFPKRFPDRAKAQAVVAAGQEAIGNAIYGGRMGNGPGEGFKYRGRGYIQLTGKDNYKAFAKASGLDVVNNPDLVSSPEGAIKASLWYWNSRKGLRDAAKKGDVNTATKLINGGTNGLADRQQKYAKYLQMVKSGDYSKMGAAPQGSASTGTAPASASAAPATSPKTSAAATTPATPPSGATTASGSSSPAGDATTTGKSATYNASTASAATPAVAASAGPKATSGAAGAMALCRPELVALGKTHYRLKDKTVTLAGMNELFMSLFYAMLGEAKQKGCMVVQINEGVRTLAEQNRLYNLYLAGKGPLAAKPGTSRHGKGEAMDCNTVNCDELDKKGLLAKYGFSRPLMKRLKNGKMTETWHIENKYVPKAGGTAPQYPKVNDPADAQTAQRAPGEIGGRQSVVNTGNAAINDVVNQGGGANTASVASAQQADSLAQSGVASILTKQLAVQTEMKSVLVEIRDHLIKGNDPKAKQELDQLKKPQSAEDMGAAIGGNIADFLANKFGLGKPAETAKPLPVISASK